MSIIASSTVDQGGCTKISAIHSDILQTHILTRLDGPALASASCASSQLHALTSEDNLWRDISASTWPSTNTPRVQDIISTFPSRHRSFFSDSFPLPTDGGAANKHRQRLTCSPTGIISAVDIYYKNEVILSRVQEADTVTGWFHCTPFRVDLLDPKETVSTSIPHAGGGDKVQSQLEENLTVSWIVIDPTRKRAANVSSFRPVSVQRHWLSGDVQVRFGSIFAGGPSKDSELSQCAIIVTCGGKEGGELHVKEVSMVVEDMDGKILNGEESLVILQGAIESEKRKKGKRGEGKEMYEKYLIVKRERRERKEKREKRLDMFCMSLGITIFFAFWYFVLFR